MSPLQALLGRELIGNAAGIDGQTVVVKNAAQLDRLVGWEIQFQQAVQLRIAIVLDDVYAFMRGHEVVNLVRERIGANAQVINVELVLLLDLVKAFAHREVRAAEGEESDF